MNQEAICDISSLSAVEPEPEKFRPLIAPAMATVLVLGSARGHPIALHDACGGTVPLADAAGGNLSASVIADQSSLVRSTASSRMRLVAMEADLLMQEQFWAEEQ